MDNWLEDPWLRHKASWYRFYKDWEEDRRYEEIKSQENKDADLLD